MRSPGRNREAARTLWSGMARFLALCLVLAMAGCTTPAPDAEVTAPAGPIVEGWVVDERLVPIAQAQVRVAGLGLNTSTDANGHYSLSPPGQVDLVVILEADGFVAQSRSIGARSGERHVLNFTLERIPDARPYHTVTTHAGVLRCGAVAVLAEDPSRPHEHQGLRCSQTLEDTRNAWLYDAPSNTTGIILEVAWVPQSELAQALVLKVVAEGTGDLLAFIEGTSVLRVQLSAVNLAQLLTLGQPTLRITLEPGAGTGNHEHGAAGAFVEQAFDVYATAFFNGPVDASYSITRP